MKLLSMLLTLVLLADLADLAVTAAAVDSFTFNGFKGASLNLSETAVITSGGLLLLTNNTPQVTGHAFYPFKLRLRNSFSSTFVFAIAPMIPGRSGHGLALVLSPSRDFRDAVSSQHLGLFTDAGKPGGNIIAVELDTVMNKEFKDIDDNHVGIDVDSLVSNKSAPAGYTKNGQFESLVLISGDPMQVWVDYRDDAMELAVAMALLGEPKPESPLVSAKINLSALILDEMYVGFSSSTGAATGCHYILGWSFSVNNGDAPPLDPGALPRLPRQGGKKTNVLPISLTLAGVIILLVSAAVVFYIVKRGKKFAELVEDWEIQYGPDRFTYKDLYRATRGFSEESVLGVGGFGRVYKGVLPKARTEIAVKKISHESRQGMREFVAEIVSMGRLRHRNLVQLLGYCRRQGELILVYEFMANGSLDGFLFDDNRPPLNWSQRFRIIKGVAAGLLYLHEGWEQVVIHRDIKASNVLLDGDFNPKLGDFGLARLYDHGSNPQTTRIVGTLGYLAPELSRTAKATTSTDAFAFGAFLLEVACGRRPLDLGARGDAPGLVEFVLERWKAGWILGASDPRLGGEYVKKEMELVLKLGVFLSHPEPSARPSMKQVVCFLEGEDALPTMSPEGISSSLSARRYDESFDAFLKSYPSTSEVTTHMPFSSSPLFPETR